ncbi:uncharacterized protein LOC142785409 [Rhipicephalus microplus]|uniref:uncharacterized protein LOC142785409 n=1 Tax=Rhipicephalus microplus TaxID=6941 RepID=UPI003F6D172D
MLGVDRVKRRNWRAELRKHGNGLLGVRYIFWSDVAANPAVRVATPEVQDQATAHEDHTQQVSPTNLLPAIAPGRSRSVGPVLGPCTGRRTRPRTDTPGFDLADTYGSYVRLRNAARNSSFQAAHRIVCLRGLNPRALFPTFLFLGQGTARYPRVHTAAHELAAHVQVWRDARYGSAPLGDPRFSQNSPGTWILGHPEPHPAPWSSEHTPASRPAERLARPSPMCDALVTPVLDGVGAATEQSTRIGDAMLHAGNGQPVQRTACVETRCSAQP